MKALVIAEHDNQKVKGATRALLTAALQTADQVDVLVAGADCAAVVMAVAQIAGVSSVRFVDHASLQHPLAETLAALVLTVAPEYEVILAAATTTGKNFLPRVAALLDVAQISEITAVVDRSTFVRPIYAGSDLATVRSADAIKVITVRTSAFSEAADKAEAAPVVALEFNPLPGKATFVSENMAKSSRPDLAAAKVVISGGRGLGSAENFRLLEKLADKLGAGIGASRAAVDSGYAPNDMQIGQIGRA